LITRLVERAEIRQPPRKGAHIRDAAPFVNKALACFCAILRSGAQCRICCNVRQRRIGLKVMA
jgi:hypothetical protein